MRSYLKLSVGVVLSATVMSCKPTSHPVDIGQIRSAPDSSSSPWNEFPRDTWIKNPEIPSGTYSDLGVFTIENPIPSGQHLRSISGVTGNVSGADSLFMVGDGGVLSRRTVDGIFHVQVEQLPGTNFQGVAVLPGKKLVAAVSRNGEIARLTEVETETGQKELRWIRNYQATKMQKLPYELSYQSITPRPGNDEFWVVGSHESPIRDAALFRVSSVDTGMFRVDVEVLGSQLTPGLEVFYAAHELGGIAYVGGNNGHIVKRSQNGVWLLDPQTVTSKDIQSLWIQNSERDEVWAVSEDAILHKQGGIWKKEENLPLFVNGRRNSTIKWKAISGAGAHVVVCGTSGAVIHFNGTNWEAWDTGLPQALNALWTVEQMGTLQVYVGGEQSVLLRKVKTGWETLSEGIRRDASLRSVWARNPEEVYAVGLGGTILERTTQGSSYRWREGEAYVGQRIDSDLYAVGGLINDDKVASKEVYAVGSEGTILHRTEAGWKYEGAALTKGAWYGVWVGEQQVYAVGERGLIAEKTNDSWRLTSQWVEGQVPEVAKTKLFAIRRTVNDSIFIAGENGFLIRCNLQMTSCAKEALGLTTRSINAIHGKIDEDLYALTDQDVLHRTAKGWEQVSLGGIKESKSLQLAGSTVRYQLGQRSPNVRNGVFQLITLDGSNGGRLFTKMFDAGEWKQVSVAPLLVNAITLAPEKDGNDHMYVVGEGGVIGHFLPRPRSTNVSPQ